MVKIAKASEFDFNNYLAQIQEGTGLKVTSTNNVNHADFILSGQRWPMIFFWEIDQFIVEAKGTIYVYEENGDMHLNYSLQSSGAFGRNGKIFSAGAFFMISVVFYLYLWLNGIRLEISEVMCYGIFFFLIFIIPYFFQTYMLDKYETMGINRQSNRLRKILFRNTEIMKEIGHWLDN